MSLRLLLDAHFPPRVAAVLRESGIDAAVLDAWQAGSYRHRSLAEILARANADRRVLVTYDVGTIPVLLRRLAEAGEHHGGVIFVSRRRIRSSDIGGLARALAGLAETTAQDEWTDRAHFL